MCVCVCEKAGAWQLRRYWESLSFSQSGIVLEFDQARTPLTAVSRQHQGAHREWVAWPECMHTHTNTDQCAARTHTHTNSPSPTLKASGSHRLHASAWKQGPNSHRELFIIFITLLLFWEFSLTWFYYTVIKWWVLSHAPSARSSLLCHKFIDHSNWCMTAAVDADRGLDLVSPHQHSYDTPYHHRLPSTCLMLCFLKATQKWHLSLWRRKRQIQQLLKVSPSLHPVICPTPLCCATRLERWWDWIIYMYLIVWINWITHSPAEPATSGLFGFCEGACAPDHP